MDSFHNITTSSDLIKQLQPILLQQQQESSLSPLVDEDIQQASNSTAIAHSGSERDEEEDVTNIQLLQENNIIPGNNNMPIQINVILDYILTYMQKETAKNINSSDFFESYKIISEIEDNSKSVSKLQELLVLIAEILKEHTEQRSGSQCIHTTSPPNTSQSNHVLLENLGSASMSMSNRELSNISIIDNLTSLLVSECVKNNIVLQVTQASNGGGYSMLETAIQELVHVASSNESKQKDLLKKSPTLEDASSAEPSTELLALKLKDLQLAHDFLSEKFSKERLYYNNQIAVKETQLSDLKKELQEKDDQIRFLKDQYQALKDEIKEPKPLTPYSESNENNNLLTSPASLSSSSSESISILRAEFKSQLNKIKDYYELELEKLRK